MKQAEKPCECGCGEPVLSPDAWGREVRYVPGHHTKNGAAERTLRDLVLDLGPIQAGPLHALVCAHYTYSGLLSALRRLRDRGEIVNVRGVGWASPSADLPEPKVASTERVPCGCGCGEMIFKWDRWRREVRFVYGHQNRRAAG